MFRRTASTFDGSRTWNCIALPDTAALGWILARRIARRKLEVEQALHALHLLVEEHHDADVLAELPDFNRFLGRLSVAMSHGEPAADVAWLRADLVFWQERIGVGKTEAAE